ncbi:MAG TPA: hypothetical protein VHE35_20685 [Kofleriaceae bacterium]|nr:hypothetical protein [Kofleriaceae bacterium]
MSGTVTMRRALPVPATLAVAVAAAVTVVLVLGGGATVARAGPPAGPPGGQPAAPAAETLVVVDLRPSVEAALRATLAPWGVRIVDVAAPPSGDPRAVAAEHGAAYVAWRRGDELVLYDVALATERRRRVKPTPDDADAAAVALFVKTWMGLGPSGSDDCAGRCADGSPRGWLIEVASGARLSIAGEDNVGFRYALAAGHGDGLLEAGLRLDLGGSADGAARAPDGTWQLVSVAAWGRVAVDASRSIAIVPGVGAGLVHLAFSAPRKMPMGPAMQTDSASASAFAVEATVDVRWHRGRLAVGGRLGATYLPSAHTLKVRNMSYAVDAHVEPWLLATVSVGL